MVERKRRSGSGEHERGPARGRRLRMSVTALLCVAWPLAAEAQTRNVRVFLDCQSHGCDRDEFRTEIDFVDWVLEPTAADVHVIFTSQDTGAGTRYIFDFIGRGDMEGLDFELPQDVPATATSEERLRAVTRAFRAGLVPYVSRSGYADRLEIRGVDRREREVRPAPTDDPWNQWVFTLGAQAEADGEQREESWELSGSASANRTTPLWKIEAELNGWFYHRRVELNEGEEFLNETRDWAVAVLAVNSLSGHWSAGSELEASRSTRLNRRFGGRTALALEWNLYPYAEANRRQLLVHYQLGVSRVAYEDTTIFDQLDDTLLDQRIVAAYQSRQPWGDASVSSHFSSYLHDLSKFSVSTQAEASIRLLRGLELDLRGRYEVIRDQLYLPKEELSNEEILVQRRALATGYEYGFDVGLSYRFGSIYNNVVNNRFPWVVRAFD